MDCLYNDSKHDQTKIGTVPIFSHNGEIGAGISSDVWVDVVDSVSSMLDIIKVVELGGWEPLVCLQ